MEKGYPLIIVFYLDAEMMRMRDIIQPFVESVNNLLAQKDANALAFFLPTTGEERIECINPTIVAEADMEKINNMVEEIKQTFSVGAEIKLDQEEIDLDSKDCPCGGDCKCDKE